MQLIFKIEFLLVDFTIRIFKNIRPSDRYWVHVWSGFLLVHLQAVLKDLRSQGERNCVRDVDDDRVAYLVR